MMYDLSKEYIQYNEDILSGRIPSCKNIYKACQRFKSWFDREDYYFDFEDVDKRIRFVQHLKHFKDKSAGKPFILLPYQQWIYANLFGWKYKASGLRVTRKVLLFMARKAGKTALAASICLSQIIQDKNRGQEIDLLANNGQQARLCFEYVKMFAHSLDPDNEILRKLRDSIKMPYTDSEICVRNAESMTLDGLNSSTFIIDEFHEAKNWDLYNVLRESQGFQTQPLSIIITTAGFRLDGYPLYEMRKLCVEILNGTKEDDAQFSALYELDEGDDYRDESVWIKANPSLGITNTYEALREYVVEAKNQPSTEYSVKTKNFNVFTQSNMTWIYADIIRSCMKPIDFSSLDRKEYVWAGIDLSSTMDLTCFTIMLKPNSERTIYPDKYIFKTWAYVSEYGMEKSVNKTLYQKWIEDGHLNLIEGNVIDYDRIMNDILEQKKFIRYDLLGYDKFNASQFVINCTNKGLQMQPFSQTLGAFNLPTKEFERLILSGQVVMDYNPLVIWAFNNVVLDIDDRTDNIKPGKPTKEAKIDPVITIIESLGTYLYSQGIIGSGDTEIYTGKKQ